MIGRNRNSSGEIEDWQRYTCRTATPEFDGDIEYAPLWAGESISVVNDIKPAGEIVEDLVRQAADTLAASATPAGESHS